MLLTFKNCSEPLHRSYGSFYVNVNGGRMTYTQEYDPDYRNQVGTVRTFREPMVFYTKKVSSSYEYKLW